MSLFDVAIVGAGPAGSAAAITLARAGHSVLLLESKPIPNDKLCGEFLSPECQKVLDELEVSQAVRALRPIAVRESSIIADDGTRWRAALPADAWALSRYRFDYALIEEAGRRGAVVHDKQVCIRISGNLDEQFEVSVRNVRSEIQEKYRARVVVGAHGKRSTMDRLLKREFLGKRYSLFAMKRHFRGASPGGVVLYGVAGGYCGLAPVEDGSVNLCFLADERIFRFNAQSREWSPARETMAVRAPGVQRTVNRMSGDARNRFLLDHMSLANAGLGEWLRGAEPCGDEWLSVGALAFGARGCIAGDVLLTGDAAGLIAPLAGDGIAMALQGGSMCARAIADYLRGAVSPDQLKERYTRAWNHEFVPRIRLAGALQSLALSPLRLRATLKLFARVPALGRWAMRHTRGT